MFGKKKKTDTAEKKRFGWSRIFSFRSLDEDFFEELEEKLIEADVGGQNSIDIIEKFRSEVKERGIKDEDEARVCLKEIIASYFLPGKFELAEDRTNVLVIIGVNGAGKTTTISKLAGRFKDQGSIIFGAADTFRAAAREQLLELAERTGTPVIGQAAGSDSASVAYDTVHSAVSKKIDIAVIDTAGRLHNKENLVEQLAKLDRVVDKFKTNIRKQNILVLDATLGQSGFEQVRAFQEKIKIDGIIMTKLDTQARGGILVSVSEKLKVPVYFLCHGEKTEDISSFDLQEYLDSLI